MVFRFTLVLPLLIASVLGAPAAVEIRDPTTNLAPYENLTITFYEDTICQGIDGRSWNITNLVPGAVSYIDPAKPGLWWTSVRASRPFTELEHLTLFSSEIPSGFQKIPGLVDNCQHPTGDDIHYVPGGIPDKIHTGEGWSCLLLRFGNQCVRVN